MNCEVILSQTMVVVIISEAMIASLGFRDCLLTSGGMMLLNIATGIIHRQPIKTDSHETMAPANDRKISLKIQGTCRSVYKIVE